MASRSWMAAWTLAAALAATTSADDRRAPATAEPATTTGEGVKAKAVVRPVAPDRNVVRLELQIAGLGSKGCEVEVKPAYAGCTFRTVTRHVDIRGLATLDLDDVRTESADRDCTFAITIREPGQAERTVHRGLRLKAPGSPGAQLLSCYLSSPSRLARTAGQAATKR